MASIDELVGSRLSLARKARAMTSEHLAQSLKITVNELNAIEAGEIRLNAELMFRVCQILAIVPHFFFDEEHQARLYLAETSAPGLASTSKH